MATAGLTTVIEIVFIVQARLDRAESGQPYLLEPRFTQALGNPGAVRVIAKRGAE